MNSTREEALFQLALSKPKAERAACLDAECEGNATLRARLDALLAAHEATSDFLGDEPASEDLTSTVHLPEPAPDEAVGMTLGRYKLREKLGEGGCGTVYVAEQTDPVRQRARAGEAHANRLLYAADMKQAQQSLKEGNLGRARRLLNRHRPASDQEDLRGWEWRYLWHLSRGDALAELARHSSACFSVRFSPDGTRLATGYLEGDPELWDVPHRVRLKQFRSEAWMAQAAFSPRSNVLATTTGLGPLRLHDLSSGRESVLWQGSNGLRTLAFTPDGSRLLAVTSDSAVEAQAVLLDLSRGVALSTNTINGGNLHFGNARLSSDGTRLFLSPPSNPGSSRVTCLDAETGQEIWATELGKELGVTAMALSPDDKVLATATGYDDATIRILDTKTGRLIARLEGHSGWVREATFSRDGRCLASASADQTLRLWETTGWTQARILRGHEAEVWSVDFSPDARMLASGSKDGVILLWDLEAATHPSAYGYRPLPSGLTCAGESAPGVVFGESPDVHGLKFITLRLEDMSPSEVALPVDPSLLRVFRSPNIFCVYDQTNTLSLWELQPVPTELFRASVGPNVVLWTGIPRPAFAYARGDHQIAWGEAPNTVHIASLDHPTRRWRWTSGLRSPAPRLLSPDGRLVILQAAPPGPCLEVREVATGNLVLRSDIPVNFPKPYFADSGRKLVILMDARVVHFWDLEHPDRPPVTFTEQSPISAISVSPDGRWVAATSEFGFAALYEASTMKRVDSIQGSRQGVHGSGFSTDSLSLATSSGRQEAIQLWQVDTRQELLTLAGTGSLLNSVAFVESGNTLLVGRLGQPGTWQMWRAPSWEYIQAAEARQPTEIAQFQRELGRRRIPVNNTAENLEQDLQAAAELAR